MYIAAFPDLQLAAEDILSSGDKAVARARATGTHQGEFMGIPATGKSIDVQLIDIIRFGDDGLAREHWGVFDALAMCSSSAWLRPRRCDEALSPATRAARARALRSRASRGRSRASPR